MNNRNLIAILASMFAFHAAQAMTIHVTSLSDNGAGSLRAAVGASMAGDTIDFPGLSGAIQLTTGELLLTHDLFISGPGATNLAIASTNARLFTMSGGSI